MPPIIADQPWPPDVGDDLRHPDGRLVVCPATGRPLRTLHDQIIIWAALTSDPSIPPTVGAVLFPVVIDTGFNETFMMRQRHAEEWVTPAVFATTRIRWSAFRVGREVVPGWDLALWVYPNVPGTRDPDPTAVPVWIDLPQGVPLTPHGSAYAKEKPLLGLKAIRFNRLSLRFDGALQRVWLDAP